MRFQLLKWVTQAESMAVDGFYDDGWDPAEDQGGQVQLLQTLGRLANLRHFTLISGLIRMRALRWLSTKWPKLETLTGCESGAYLDNYEPTAQSIGAFEACRALKSLVLYTRHTWNNLNRVFLNLSPTLRKLTLTIHLAVYAFTASSAVLDQVGAVAPCLEEFNLIVSSCDYWHPRFRGSFGSFVAELSAVRRLSLPPYALTDVCDTLVPLTELTSLKLTGFPVNVNHYVWSPDCSAIKVLHLVQGSASLRSLSIERGVYHSDRVPTGWTIHQIDEISRAAELKSIFLVWN